MREDELERLIIANSPRFQSILALAEQQIREGQDIQHEEFWREIEAKNAETSE